MSLSRRAKRGISIFQKIQWSPNRARYHLSPRMMIDLNAKPQLPPLNPELAAAATEAMEILVKNGEKANADLQAIREQENNAVTPSEEGCAPGDVHVQQNDNQESEEGGPDSAPRHEGDAQ